MVLEMVTLAILAAVLIVKYGTSAHLAKLNQRQLELDNQCQQFQSRYKALAADRKATEGEERRIQTNIAKLEAKLEDVKDDLADQEERNRDLRDRASD
jgi:peptidoglycan hydrolase CwlO-like protein